MPRDPRIKLRTMSETIKKKVNEMQQATVKASDAPEKGTTAMVLPQPHHFNDVLAAMIVIDKILE
jgi:hypothetical protein